MNDRELTRLADAAAALRPDWKAAQIRVFLAKHCRHRAFADAAVALAVLAVDETQVTPRLLAEPGSRCWRSAQAVVAMHAGTSPETPHPMCVEHPDQPAGRCGACEAEAVPPPPEVVAVANRNRTRVIVAPSTTGRDFGQPDPMPSRDAAVVACDSCGAAYLPGDDGAKAHRVVFGHSPTVKAESEAS